MTHPLFNIVVVLYKKMPNQSSTLTSLSRVEENTKASIRLTIRDNSPQPIPDNEMEVLNGLLKGIHYEYRHHDGQNVSLSRIYNESIKELKEEEYLVIFDDDSEFSDGFFTTALKSIKEHPDCDLFLPVVNYGKQIVSPAYMWYFKGHFLKEVLPGMMPCKNITAINSGMVISARYLKHGYEGYDERIRFYGTDCDFMCRYTASHSHLCVLDYHTHHTLNYYEDDEPFQKASARYKDQRRGLFILMKRQGFLIYALTHVYWLVFSLKYALHKRDIRYIFIK